MGEILFRGKTDKGKWVEGFYCPCCFGRFPCSPAIISKEDIDNGWWHPEKVIPETVGQYTGLTDKYGKKIFEGDIIKNQCEKNKYQYFKISYCNRTYCWLVVNKYRMLGNLYNVIGDIEVIGNIHDNKLEDFENGC